jgi:hypothetical protein
MPNATIDGPKIHDINIKGDDMHYKKPGQERCLLLVLLFLFVCLGALSVQAEESGRRVERGYAFLGFKGDEYVRICYITESGTLIPLSTEYSQEIMDKGFNVIITSHGKKIFYSRCNWMDDEPKYNIYTIDIIKDVTRQLTQNDRGQEISLMDISPDGKNILFSEFLENTLDICVMGAEGENRTTLATVEDLEHGWIFGRWLNNTEIIFDAHNDTVHSAGYYEDHELIKINVNTLCAQVLYSGEFLGKWRNLSRDGKLIFENEDNKDGYFDTSTLTVHYFNLKPEYNDQYIWAPGSKKIMFHSTEFQKPGLYIMDAATYAYQRIVTVTSDEIYFAGWINNGEDFIYIEFNDDYEGCFYKVNVNSKIISNLTNQTGYKESIGMACPHLFAYNGTEFVKLGEIIGRNIDRDSEKTEIINIASVYIQNNELVIRIEESLYEITCLNYISLKVGQTSVQPHDCPSELKKIDDSYLILKKGEAVELRFRIPENDVQGLRLECRGYYEPLY